MKENLKEEFIKVTHYDHEEQFDEKEIDFEYGNYSINIRIPGHKNAFKSLSVSVHNNKCKEGLDICIEDINCELGISFKEDDRVEKATKSKTFRQQKDLEQLSLALKVIGKCLKD
jgi:hypothetical protein